MSMGEGQIHPTNIGGWISFFREVPDVLDASTLQEEASQTHRIMPEDEKCAIFCSVRMLCGCVFRHRFPGLSGFVTLFQGGSPLPAQDEVGDRQHGVPEAAALLRHVGQEATQGAL